MKKRTPCVGVVAYDRNMVLLVQHTETARLPTGSYGFPAGRVKEDEDEDPIDAAIRELEEETGYTTTREHLHRIPEKRSTLRMQEGTEDFVFIPYVCTRYWGEPKRSEDNIPKWVELSKLNKILLVAPDVLTISREYHGHFPNEYNL